MIERLLRFIVGYVKIDINGFNTSRFLNLVMVRNIHIWNIVNSGIDVSFCIAPKDVYELKPIIRKMKLRTNVKNDKEIFKFRIKERYGLPFLLYSYRKRKIFCLGIFIGWFIVYIMSLHIWNISFEGNFKHTDEELYRFLQNIDITEGIKKDVISGEVIEKALRNEYFDITWASVDITGTKLTVYVRENINDSSGKGEMDNKDGNKNVGEDRQEENLNMGDEPPGDLIADKPCEIVSIVTRSGKPMVKEGDIVEKGSVIISGKFELYKDDMTVLNEKMVRADGDVVGKVVYTVDESIPREYVKKEYTGNEYEVINGKLDRYHMEARIHIGSKKFKKYDVYTYYDQIVVGESFYMPIFTEKIVYKEYQLNDALYTDEQLEVLASQKIMYKIKKIEENTIQILENNVKIEISEKLCRIYGQVTVLEYIGVFGGTYE